jgi:hypothetical protein
MMTFRLTLQQIGNFAIPEDIDYANFRHVARIVGDLRGMQAEISVSWDEFSTVK